jgi:hypothetical protein
MLEDHDEPSSIVVLEAGAVWPPWLAEYQRLAPNAVVIAQAGGEAPAIFEQRVLHRIQGATLRVGVIVSADAPGQSRAAMRRNIAQALAKSLAAQPEAELVLAGDSGDLEASRHELFALAGTLCEALGGTHVNVRVRFSNSRSGVISVAPSSPELEPVLSKA